MARLPKFVVGTLCLLASVGCAQKKPTVATELVEGVVTLDGQPVPGATVTFAPVTEGAGAPATGMTDSSGKYTLTAIGSSVIGAQPGAGTLPGEYFVGVVKSEMPRVPGSLDPDYKSQDPSQAPESPKVTYIVPQQYNSPQDSGIKATVKPGKNDIPIELKSK